MKPDASRRVSATAATLSALRLLGLSLCFASALQAAPPPTATITESDIFGLEGAANSFWVFDTFDTDGPGVGGDPSLSLAAPPSLLAGYGASSVRMDTGPGTGGVGCARLGGKVFLGTRALAGTRLRDLLALGYSHLVDSTNGEPSAAPLTPAIHIYVDRNGDGQWRGGEDSILIYEPFYTLGQPIQDVWYDNQAIGAGAAGRWHYVAQSLPGVGLFVPNTVDLWDEVISQVVGGPGFDPSSTTIGDLRIVNPDPGCSPSDSQEGTGSGLVITVGQKSGSPWDNFVAFVDGVYLTSSGTAAQDFVHNFDAALQAFTVGGTVSGLVGAGLVLRNNGGDDLPIGGNGAFTFSTALPDLSPYAVTVQAQPDAPSQTCTVGNGTGALTGANVTDISISCSTDSFTVGGTVSGLLGTGLMLRNNGGDDLPIGGNGAFTFSTALPDLSIYAVTVQVQPEGQICAVSNGSGALGGDNVTDVAVGCGSITIGLSANVLSFLSVPASDAASSPLVISNPGVVPLRLLSISQPDSPFAISASTCQPLPLTLAPGEQCMLTVQFSARRGAYASQIQIETDAFPAVSVVELRGNGVLAVPMFGQAGLWLLLGLVFAVAWVHLRHTR